MKTKRRPAPRPAAALQKIRGDCAEMTSHGWAQTVKLEARRHAN